MRSESEKSFNECQIKRARLQSLGLAYLSPQNKSLAQSFRYMRNKPTIIAFKTPSLENCEQKQSSSSFGSVGKIVVNITPLKYYILEIELFILGLTGLFFWFIGGEYMCKTQFSGLAVPSPIWPPFWGGKCICFFAIS